MLVFQATGRLRQEEFWVASQSGIYNKLESCWKNKTRKQFDNVVFGREHSCFSIPQNKVITYLQSIYMPALTTVLTLLQLVFVPVLTTFSISEQGYLLS